MKHIATIVMLLTLGASGNVFAECPAGLTPDQMYDCIVAEGSGQSYEDYSKDVARIEADILGERQTVSASEK